MLITDNNEYLYVTLEVADKTQHQSILAGQEGPSAITPHLEKLEQEIGVSDLLRHL